MLLKGVDPRGFVFFTNYESRKGRDLADNPAAAVTFLWKELERQVRIEGKVERVSRRGIHRLLRLAPARLAHRGLGLAAERDDREPRVAGGALGALDRRARREARSVPPNWGGYRLLPDYLEFWQGRQSRLHDRVAYTRDAQGWRIRRLAP